jgi:two-component system, OmpR family, sensor histidine kinase SenX3
MNRARQWMTRNLDVLLFGAALSSVGPLMAWWSVLVRRNITSTDRLLRAQVESAFDGAQKLERLAALDAATNRQLFMISGESTLAGFLLCVLAVVLFVVARQRRLETQRLQSMLQLTTHQLKTPLAGVRALLQSLGGGVIPAEMQGKFINQGIAECDRLEHLVETTLAYQRAVGRQAARTEVVATKELVNQILEHRRASFPEDEVRWQPGAELAVSCDRDAVRVVLENLLDNARKYGGGKVEMSDVTRGAKWRLEVKDHGQGFLMTDAERLFEPFERGGGTGVAHGSGLGLYISRQLARRMQGELTATSDGPGKGSTFALELPVAREVARG